MKIAETVTFGGLNGTGSYESGLDRAAHQRGRSSELWGDKNARVLPVWRGKPLVSDDGAICWVPTDHAVLESASDTRLLLGFIENAPHFAADLSAWEPENLDPEALAQFIDKSVQQHPALPADRSFTEIRSVMSQFSPLDAELAATARALFEWHRFHGFCSNCGEKTEVSQGGWQRHCNACGRQHFPRTDPVVIMLVLRGNSVLVGRSPGWPETMYSLLAGFLEPGETVEAAVRREVAEETAVQVGRVDYLASQPWPFPASLMIGCRGFAISDAIEVDPKEIEKAMWITREEMMEVFAGNRPDMTPARKGSIAHFLLSNWLADRLD